MRHSSVDFDAEAKALFSRLNLEGTVSATGHSTSVYNHMDAIWRDPATGGTIFVGNQSAAQNKAFLVSNGVTHVVNCTSNMPQYHERDPSEPRLTYHRFDIATWQRHGREILSFLTPVFEFIDGAIAKGGSVLVHCLAGAHRAGTTGCLLLMHKARMPVIEAVRAAKRLRPVIDPIGSLPQLLHGYEQARDQKDALPASLRPACSAS